MSIAASTRHSGLVAVNGQPPGQNPLDWDATETIRCFAIRRAALTLNTQTPPDPQG